MMTPLDHAISAAFAKEGQGQTANTVYLTLLRTKLFLPTQKNYHGDEPFAPLFTTIDGNYFLIGFDTEERLTGWAGDQLHTMNYVTLSGRDLITGINEHAYFWLNTGTPYGKEFPPDEIIQLKNLVAKIDKLTQTTH